MQGNTWDDGSAERALLPSMIPAKWRPVVDIIGVSAFLRMCEMWGGGGHYFPSHDNIIAKHERVSLASVPAKDYEFASMIGINKYLSLIQVLGGGGRHVYIPAKKVFMRPVRNLRLRADYVGGMSYADLIQKYHMTSSAMQVVSNGLRAERHRAIRRNKRKGRVKGNG